MGWLEDLLKEVPLSAVMQERVKLAEDKFARANEENAILKQRIGLLENENEGLRASMPQQKDASTLVSDDTKQVLVHMFRAKTIEERDVGAMSRSLGMESSMLNYHLDRLHENGLADCTGGNYVDGHVYWALSPRGRQFAVERKLV